MDDHPEGIQTWIVAISTPFDRAWLAGQRPRMEDFLTGSERPGRLSLLGELLRIELMHRRKAGETPEPDEYEHRFAEYPEVVRAAFAGPDAVPIPADRSTDLNPTENPLVVQGAARSGEDATLSYSVFKADGQVGPFLAPEHHHRLEEAFRTGVLIQDRYRIEQ